MFFFEDLVSDFSNQQEEPISIQLNSVLDKWTEENSSKLSINLHKIVEILKKREEKHRIDCTNTTE